MECDRQRIEALQSEKRDRIVPIALLVNGRTQVVGRVGKIEIYLVRGILSSICPPTKVSSDTKIWWATVDWGLPSAKGFIAPVSHPTDSAQFLV